MAVEVNKRKRKHQSSGGGDNEGAEVVPKKQIKKSLTPQKKKEKRLKQTANAAQTSKENEDVMEDAQQDSGFEPEEKEIQFSKEFKMMDFRTKLRGANFLTELRHFLYLASSKPQIIAKYIEKRGKPLEIAEALERIDKTNIVHISYLCEALQLVIMEIMSNQSNHMESAVHASRYFLKTHGNLLELLLKSAQMNHRKVALKLLTAIVCVEPQLGRQILTSYDILSNVKTVQQFLSHSQYEVQQQQLHNDAEYETVRKCFIHFVLAYLVEGNTLLIRNILDKGTLIRVLASGLMYDDSVTVCVVLSTLKKYILECSEISKTKKIHVFDLQCCKSFVQLYDWRGPKVFAAKFSGGGGKKDRAEKNLSFSEMEKLVNAKDREAVEKSAHEFLMVLLTSRKYGITFDTSKFFRQKHNTIQGQIIGFIHCPWNNDLKTELVIKMLETCPDLFRHTVRNYAGIINPMRTPSRYWLQAANFLAKVISACHPNCLKGGALDKITLTDFSYWIKDICLPIETLVHINGSKLLTNKNFQHRLASNRLLLAMFTQYSNYLKVIGQREQNKSSNNALRKFRFDILNHLLMNFPTMEVIMSSLNTSIQNQHDPEVNVLLHLNIALDLVLAICQESRSFVNKTSVILDYLELLRPLYASEDVLNLSEEKATISIKLEMKSVKTILWLFPKALDPTKERFSTILSSFIKAFVWGTPEISREAGLLLRCIFKNTGIFDSAELEIDLWLEALKFFDQEAVNIIAQVFNEVLKVTKADVKLPKSLDTITVVNKENLSILFNNIENGLSVQAYVETPCISKLMPLIFKGVQIEAPLSDYLEVVCLLMFHYYPQPEYVLGLYEQQFKTLKPYMQNWLSAATAAMPMKKLQLNAQSLKSANVKLQDIQDYMLHGSKTSADFENLFQLTEDAAGFAPKQLSEFEFKGKILMCCSKVLENERLLMIYIQQVLFMVQQLQQKSALTADQSTNAAELVIECLKFIEKYEKTEEVSILALPNSIDDDGKATATEQELQNASFFQNLVKYIYGIKLNAIKSSDLLLLSSDADAAKVACYENFLKFLIDITSHCRQLSCFDSFAKNFKLKLVKAVAISLNSKQDCCTLVNSEKLQSFLNLIKVFNLDAEHCMEILNLLATNISYKDFFVTGEDGAVVAQQKTIYHQLLQIVLQRLAELKVAVDCKEFVRKFGKMYIGLFEKLANSDINLESLEEALYEFLLINHQQIENLGRKFFAGFFKSTRKLHKSSIKLCCLIFERDNDDQLNDIFLEQLEQNFDKKELMYPLMELAFGKANLEMPQPVLQKIYQNYKNGFMRSIEKPHKAGAIYKEHFATTLRLIALCMPVTECRDFCQKQFKFEQIEPYQIRTVCAIYDKAFGNAELKHKSQIYVNFLMLQIQMLALDMKLQKLTHEKLEIIAYQLYLWLEAGKNLAATELETEEQSQFQPDFSKIFKSQLWQQFCKTCLKTAMHVNESTVTDKANDESEDRFNGLLLKLMAFVIDFIYEDYTEDAMETLSPQQDCQQLYEMIFTHSKFFDVLLQPSSTTLVKTEILHLLYVLARKAPAALQSKQISVILGAYQAKLSQADRYALALLNLFELYDCEGLAKYRPFIWGESAIAFYALRAADDQERSKLTQQETSIAQVMSLVDRQTCEYSLDNFPLWRKLDTLQQLPDIEFCNPYSKPWQFGVNQLEQKIEMGCSDFQEQELRCCPKRQQIYEESYDPAFFVPLMSMCFAPESYSHPARPVQNGLLSMVFAALSSQDKDMRLAAGNVQLRYRQHFENSKFMERPLWIQTYENIQSGLSSLRASWMKHKKNSGTPRVPYISGLFVAKTINITTDPVHLLYKQLTMYLRLKSSFNFQCIPEFNVLFYSAEMEHQEFRQFILEIIKHGIKTSSDLFLLVTTNTFKVLMGFYGTTMSTLDINLLILSLMSTCVKIPASSKIMLENVGILPWLSAIISSIEFYQFDVIEGLIAILNNLWYAFKANVKEFHNAAYIEQELNKLILNLLPLISPRISVNNFSKLLNILCKTSSKPEQYQALSKDALRKIISCCEKHFGAEQIFSIESIFAHGSKGCASKQSYCKYLFGQHLDQSSRLALSSLREYVANWWPCWHSVQCSVFE